MVGSVHVPRQRGAGRVARHPAGSSDRARPQGCPPVTRRRLGVAGVPTAILECGDGPPLVLLHGDVVGGSVMWAPVIRALARRHHLVIPDLPGLGESKSVARLDAAFNTWFAKLLNLTLTERPTVVALSLSGGWAARFALRYGDHLERLVLAASPAVTPHRPPVGFALATGRFGRWPSERNAEGLDRWSFRDPDTIRRRDPVWYQAFAGERRSRTSVAEVRRTIRQLRTSAAQQLPATELERIRVPTSLLWGRHDRVVPLRVGESASRRFGWPLQVIEEAGHLAHVERPDAFLRALSMLVPLPP